MNSGFMWPVSGKISSPFGKRSAPTDGASSNHAGVDFSVPVGTSVMAAMGGVVSSLMYSKERGSYITIDHGNGTKTIYQHLQRFAVEKGQQVAAGQKIALSGNSGRSTGPHLHFELLQNGEAIDPATYNPAVNAVSGALSGVAGTINSSGIVAVLEQYWYLIAGGLIIIGLLSKAKS